MTSTYSFQLGSAQFILMNDGSVPGNAGSLVVGVREDRIREALQEMGMAEAPDTLDTSAMLFHLDGSWNLVDCGRGQGVGRVRGVLADRGVDPVAVETVIITHADGDHTGGALNETGELTFANARFHMSRQAWGAWTDEALLEAMAPERAQLARAVASRMADSLELIEPGQEVLDGVRALAAPGHRDGHLALEFDVEGHKLLHVVDSCLHLIFLRHPEWHCAYDSYPERAVETRQQLLAAATEGGHPIVATHLPFPGLGRVVESQVGFGWQPVE